MLLDMVPAKHCAKTRRGTQCQSPAMPNGRCQPLVCLKWFPQNRRTEGYGLLKQQCPAVRF
jgi:hypothetical protein